MSTYANGESVVFNQQPFYMMMQQRAQQKRLEDAALNKQIEDDLGKIQTKGIRDVDTENILSQYARIKDMGIAYREAIRNPAKNPKAYREYRDAWQKIQNDIAASQDAKERAKTLYTFYGSNHDKIDTDAFKQKMSGINAAIGTPEYETTKNFNLDDIVFKDEKFDMGKWNTAILAAAPGKNVNIPERLPNGQYKNVKSFERDPVALGTAAATAYDANLHGAEKYFNNQFAKLDPEQKLTYEEYVKQYDPKFEIKTPKDLAVATALFGKVKQDMGYDISGPDQAFAMAQQQRAFNQAEKMAALQEQNIRTRPTKSKSEEDYVLAKDIAKDMSSGNISRALEPFQSYASPGTVVTYLHSKVLDNGMLDRIYKDLRKDGVDAKTRLIDRSALNDGAIVVGVPKINPQTKEPMPGYNYMIVTNKDKRPESRINALLNYAKGGTITPLKDSYYKKRSEEEPLIQPQMLSEGSLNDVDENQ